MFKSLLFARCSYDMCYCTNSWNKTGNANTINHCTSVAFVDVMSKLFELCTSVILESFLTTIDNQSESKVGYFNK